MSRRFYGFFARGLEHLECADPDRAVIVCSNHTNWWDGFAASLLTPYFPSRRVFLAQYEKLLERYKPLRWLGVFGLDRDGGALPGLRYALKLLSDSRNMVWIFPQGVLAPQWIPISVKPGALWLARRSGARIIPIAFRYEWMVESRPSIFVNCGQALPRETTADDLGRAIQELYDAIGGTLSPIDLSAYRSVFKPRMSMNKRWEKLTWRPPAAGEKFHPRNG